MSKIGKKPIQIPSGVQVTIQGDVVAVKGPKGELTKTVPAVLEIKIQDNQVLVAPTEIALQGDRKRVFQEWGLYRALIRNMTIGVSQGFEETLELQGVGYKAVPKGTDLELSLGFSHTILYKAPAGITFAVDKGTVKITGIDKETVGHVAAEIRAYKTPEPYKGHGVKYSDEIIKKKAGKKAVASG